MRPGGGLSAAAMNFGSFVVAYTTSPRRFSLSWFLLLRIIPFFLVSSLSTTSPTFSFGLLKTNGISGIANLIGQQQPPIQPYHVLPGDNTMGYPLVNADDKNNDGEKSVIVDGDHPHKDESNDDSSTSSRSSNRFGGGGGSSSVGPPRPLSEMDQKFLDRVQSSIKTVQNWEADTQLLQECRSVIPWEELRNETGLYSNTKEDRLLQGSDALFLQRLSRWFPKTFMSWVNTPPCQVCGSTECEMKTVRAAETKEEKEGEAKRVEVYYCPQCKENTTTFPRYNRAKKLLETKKGRCGEYSNLFGLFCRSVGFETRLVLDLTDHLWTEVRLGDSWIMADSCEGIIDKPSMYEYGWGKDGLCYMLAIGRDHIVDVTPRYTRDYLSEDFQTRRRAHTTSEDISAMIVKELNEELLLLRKNNNDGRKDTANDIENNDNAHTNNQHNNNNTTTTTTTTGNIMREEWQKYAAMETVELHACMQLTEWTAEEKYGRGRISGSRQWKQLRQESGKKQRESGGGGAGGAQDHGDISTFEIESLAPPIGSNMSLIVRPNPTIRHFGIEVLGTPCAVGQADAVSVVVVDEECLGCILQSRSFLNWEDVKKFVDRLPPHRIVIMNGKCPEDNNETVTFDIPRLGGWKADNNLQNGILYIGQVDAHPDWVFCSLVEDCPVEGHEIVLEVGEESLPSLELRQEHRTMPQRIAGRLPEFAMPLKAQLMATEEQKRLAFASYCADRTSRYCGYTSRPHCPIYLLNGTSYPLERLDDAYAETEHLWNTFHYLPPALVPNEDQETLAAASLKDDPKYVVPLEVGFFVTTFGKHLLSSAGPKNRIRRTPTAKALRNSRLIGLYIATHWYNKPCESFTPILAEVHEHLKQVRPVHGLDIVFASTDRDPESFENSFSSMPWYAIPFEQSQRLMKHLNRLYDVKKTPYLVVLDSVSGNVVVPASETRSEIFDAYGGGALAIEQMFASWLERSPPDTQILLNRMDIPYRESLLSSKQKDKPEKENPYLLGDPRKPNPFDAAVRIKEIFDKFISEGIDPNTAGAQALDVVSEELHIDPTMEPGALNGRAIKVGKPRSVEDTVQDAFADVIDRNSRYVVWEVLSTAQEYVRQAMKEPWSPQFRTFQLSNDVADRITRAEGGLALIQSLGLEVFGSNHDFKATIPVAADLKKVDSRISALLRDLKKVK